MYSPLGSNHGHRHHVCGVRKGEIHTVDTEISKTYRRDSRRLGQQSPSRPCWSAKDTEAHPRHSAPEPPSRPPGAVSDWCLLSWLEPGFPQMSLHRTNKTGPRIRTGTCMCCPWNQLLSSTGRFKFDSKNPLSNASREVGLMLNWLSETISLSVSYVWH